MEDRNKGVILLKDLLQRGIHIEQAFDFQTSVFFETYEDMKQSVQQIVRENRRRKRELQRPREPQEISISNVISVIGRRGTGKSSAMLSFREALEHYRKCERYMDRGSIHFSEKAEMGEVRFFALDYIDASVLEESEDIFILVLANMINYLERNVRGGEIAEERDLMHQFEVLHNDFLTVKENMQYRDEVYSSLETLVNVAGSQKIKRQFYRLVDEFLQYVRRRSGSDGNELYLVISIDDLDMAHYNTQNKLTSHVNNKSYEIVNSIGKYLSVPGVIVLTAYNHVNLMHQNENFFINSDTTDYHTGFDRTAQRKTSAQLSNQFVDKVFAISYRTYMPSWKKRDYQNDQFRIDVWTGMERKDNIFASFVEREGKYMTVHKLLLLLYWEKLGIAYDCEGQKLHFLEPDSMRRLSDTVLLFDNEEFPLVKVQSGKAALDCRRTLFRKIKGDIYFHYIPEGLYLPEEKELFSGLLELPIARRSEKIVWMISRITKPLGKETTKWEKSFRRWMERHGFLESEKNISYMEGVLRQINDNRDVRYSFAELVHSIYHMTREENGYSREFVACILHSYSIYLSELYDQYHNMKKNMQSTHLMNYWRDDTAEIDDITIYKEMEEIHNVFCSLIGDTVCGRWSEYYFPEVYTAISVDERMKKYTERVVLGYCSLDRLTFSITISQEQRQIEMAIKEIIFLLGLCVNVLEWESWKLDILSRDNSFRLNITLHERQDIEMTAFIKYAFEYPEFLRKMEYLLEKVVIEKISENIDKEQCNRILDVITYVINNLWRQFLKWDHFYGNMALPLHNFDCTYNLIKHIFQEISRQESAVEVSDGNQFFAEFAKMNSRFIRHLDNIDHFYGNQSRKNSFKEIYRNCPFLKLAEEISENEQASYELGRNIVQIVAQISAESRLEVAADSRQGSEK